MSMMPLAGVQLTAQDYAPFMAAMASASAAVSKFGSSIGGSGTAMQEANSQTQQLTFGHLALASAVGNIAANAFGAIIGKTQEFIQTSIGAVSQLQDLQINLETLAAREYLYANATDDMGEALKMGKGNAEYMLKQLQDLSIASPFQYEQIVSVFQMNMAFGQSSEMALKLTGAITNLGAVNKGIPGILQRLSYNFSQMSMVGKITARDTRDLAMAGLDLGKVLKLQLGKSVKEVNQDMASGKLTFKDVSQALVDYTDKYIGPAAKRASTTLGGLASTMKDVSFFAGANLFKQSADIIAGALSKILDKVLLFVNSDSFKAAGMVLGQISQQVVNMLGLGENYATKTTAAIGGMNEKLGISAEQYSALAQKMAKSSNEAVAEVGKNLIREQDAVRAAAVFNDNEFYQSAKKAIKWGVDLIANYADGIITGGYTFLDNALNWIADMLTGWLQPHSPPKVAPDIDVWGMATMGEWLKGFTEADFGVLDTIRGELQNALSFSVAAGLTDKNDVGSIMVGWSNSIIDVINGGDDLTKLLSEVSNAAGPFGEQVSKLVEYQFALAKATTDLTNAQKAEYSAGQNVNKQVKEYNDMVRKGATKEQLKAKMADINASRGQQIAASEARKELEKTINGTENTKGLQEQIALQSKLVSTLLELGNANIQAQATKGGGKTGGEPPEHTYALPEPPDLSYFGEEMSKVINQEISDMFGSLQTLWTSKWKDLFSSAEIRWIIFTTKIGKLFNFSSIFSTAGEMLAPFGESIQTVIDTVWGSIQTTWNTAMSNIQPAWELFVAAIGASGVTFQDVLNGIGAVVNVVFTIITAIINVIIVIIGAAINLIITIISGLVVFILTFLATWVAIWTQIQLQISTAWANIVEAFTGGDKSIQERLGLFLLGIAQFIGGLLLVMVQGIASVVVGLLAMAGDFITVGAELINGIITGLGETIGSLSEAFSAAMKAVVDGVKEFLGIESPSTVFSDIGENLIQGLIDGINGMVTTISTTIEAIITTITGYATQFTDAGTALLQGMVDGINSAIQGVIDAAVAAASGAIDAVKKALGIKSPSKVFMEIGVQSDEGLAQGIEKNSSSENAAMSMALDAQNAAKKSMEMREFNATRSEMAAYARKPMMVIGGGGKSVSVQIGNVTITNQAEGEMFQRRVELAVMNALGVG